MMFPFHKKKVYVCFLKVPTINLFEGFFWGVLVSLRTCCISEALNPELKIPIWVLFVDSFQVLRFHHVSMSSFVVCRNHKMVQKCTL